jgi:hypothetical protein
LIGSTGGVIGSTPAIPTGSTADPGAGGSTGGTTTPAPCWSIMESTQCVGACAWSDAFFFCDDASSATVVTGSTGGVIGSTTAIPTGSTADPGAGGSTGGTTTSAPCWSIMESTQCVGACAWSDAFFVCDTQTTTPGSGTTPFGGGISTTSGYITGSTGGGGGDLTQAACWTIMNSAQCVGTCAWNAVFTFCDNAADSTTGGVVGSTTAIPVVTGSSGGTTTGGGGATTTQVQCWSILNSAQCIGACAWNVEFFFCDNAGLGSTPTGGTTVRTTPGGPTGAAQCWSTFDSTQCVGACAWNVDFSFCDNAPSATGGTEAQTGGPSTTGAAQCWSIVDSTQCVGACVWNAAFSICDDRMTTRPTAGMWGGGGGGGGGAGGRAPPPRGTVREWLSYFALRSSDIV